MALPDLMDFFARHNLVIDWDDFLAQSCIRGWNLTSTLSKIDVAAFEVHGPQYRDALMEKCRLWVIATYGVPLA